jgi:hypothetical protein
MDKTMPCNGLQCCGAPRRPTLAVAPTAFFCLSTQPIDWTSIAVLGRLRAILVCLNSDRYWAGERIAHDIH